jgi:glycosyltransferase involved in cell wall biosynthesis
MSASPRVVLAMPAFNRPDKLAEAIESILSQTCRDVSLLILDDGPGEATTAIVRCYAAIDRRLYYEKNPARLGMVGNWRACFRRARERFPDSRYFAWVSDHDAWHPRWLEQLVAVLDRHPEVVLAYPRTLRHGPDGFKVFSPFETFGIADPMERLRRVSLEMLAGNLIYGLFRAEALARAGVFRPVLLPDRQVLVELSLHGQFKQVAEVLWYRELARNFSLGRQRAALFANGAPLHTYFPVALQHGAALVWSLAVRGAARPAVGRLAGLRYAWAHVGFAIARELQRPKAYWAEGREPRPIRWLRQRLAHAGTPTAAAAALEVHAAATRREEDEVSVER